MEVFYPSFSKLLGFNCHNPLKPFYTLSAIDFTVVDTLYGRSFHIPLGFESDGCTLKFKLLRMIFGCQHTPEYLTGSIVHDFFCKNRSLIDRKRATEVFKYLLIAEGVSKRKAEFMTFWVDLYQKYYRKWK